MYQHVLFAALGPSLLSGAALVRTVLVQRRRTSIEARLKTICRPTLRSENINVSLRSSHPQRSAGSTALLSRLDHILSTTGHRLRRHHVIATGLIAAAIIGVASTVIISRPAIAAVLAISAALMAPTLLVRIARGRNQRRFLNLFPDALDIIVRAVRVGLPVVEAIELAAHEIGSPVGVELEGILGEMRIGVEIEEALQHAADRIRVPDFSLFVVSLLLHKETGGSIAEVLSKLSTIIRQRKALRIKARALTAEATASAAVVAVMPLVAGVGLFLVNREVMLLLFEDARGRFMLGVASVGLLLGLIVMKAMIGKSLR